MNAWTRRDFTKTVIFAGAATALGAARVAGAAERVRVGFIGVGNRGDQVLDAFLKQPQPIRPACFHHADFGYRPSLVWNP